MHSKYAGACSDKLTLENIYATAQAKGVKLIGTGDFTHPLWFADIKSKLEEAEPGLFKLKGSKADTRFFISAEVNVVFSNTDSNNFSMFDRTGTVKRFHNVILSPSVEVAAQINDTLAKRGDLKLDGRPTLRMRASELVEIVHRISNDAIIFPAHAFTPWFGVFGSLSGFDLLKEAYEDQEQHIYAFETGLSADPSMCWRMSSLDKYTIVSGSDPHSLPKIAREATIFDFEPQQLSYRSLADAIKNKKTKMTIEFYPEEGKYHYDGHRKCNVSLSPEEAKKYNNICPVCRKPLTLGVMHRINELSDRQDGFKPQGAAPYVHCVPLLEVLAFVMKRGAYSLTVKNAYDNLIRKFGTEMNVLLKADVEQIRELDKETARAIENIREDHVNIKPGYDGVFGIVDILNVIGPSKSDPAGGHGQKTISSF